MSPAPFYKPAGRWPTIVALGAALSLELAAVGLASLQNEALIPTAPAFLSPQPIVAEFVAVPLQPILPENIAPPLPSPPSETSPEFSLVEPTPPPTVKKPRRTPAIAGPVMAIRRSGPATLSSARARLTSAPLPSYPYEARRAHQTGSGIFLLRFDAQGAVAEVAVSRSTGSAALDQSSLRTFRRWRCQPGAYQSVYVPVTFTLAGAQL